MSRHLLTRLHCNSLTTLGEHSSEGCFDFKDYVVTEQPCGEQFPAEMSRHRVGRSLALETIFPISFNRCLWKGSPCQASDIKARLTDMGVCYTFISDDMYVEQSGEYRIKPLVNGALFIGM